MYTVQITSVITVVQVVSLAVAVGLVAAMLAACFVPVLHDDPRRFSRWFNVLKVLCISALLVAGVDSILHTTRVVLPDSTTSTP